MAFAVRAGMCYLGVTAAPARREDDELARRGIFRAIFEALAIAWYHRRAVYTVPLNMISRVMPFGTVTIQRLRGVKIGRRCIIPKEVFFDDMDPYLIEVGDDVVMAPGVRIFAHVHYGARLYEYMGGRQVGRVKICSGAYLGSNVVVLRGVTIGECAVVGAGAVVTTEIAPYTLAVGVPARPVRKLDKRYKADDPTIFDVFWRKPEPLSEDAPAGTSDSGEPVAGGRAGAPAPGSAGNRLWAGPVEPGDPAEPSAAPGRRAPQARSQEDDEGPSGAS
jgi:acetyltransferase-like isoleucine patch superfamily enzyme